MKNLLCLVAFLFLLSFDACKGGTYPQVMLLADSLVSSDPDSAVFLLRSIRDEMSAQPDSVRGLIGSKEIREINALHDCALAERENSRLKTENRQEHIYLFCSVSVGVLILLCFFAYFQYSRKKHAQLNLQLLHLKHIVEEQSQKSAWLIEGRKNKQEQLTRLLQDASPEREQARKALLNSEVCLYFRKVCREEGNSCVPHEKWLLLEKTVNDRYEGFTGKLLQSCQISRHELYICLLIKIHVPPKDMAKLTSHSRESITSVRRRLYEKFFGQKGTPQLWDEFIDSL